MKKLLTFLLLLIMVILSCSKPSDEFRAEDYDGYYWSEGKKILLQKIDSKFYAVFYSANEDKFRDELLKAGIELDNAWQEVNFNTY